MRSNLAIFDVSAYVHTAMHSSDYMECKMLGFPVGGLKFFLKNLSLELSKDSDIICAFDSRSFRKDLYSGYKAGRPKNPYVFAQLNMLYEFLSKCGIACYKVETFEADDIIWNAVKQNKYNYFTVHIYGDDYDLTHNVDESKVFFDACNSNVNSINANNFCNGIKKDATIYFNTVAANKAMTGDKSDNIPVFTSRKGYSGKQIYDWFVKFLSSQERQMTSNFTTDERLFRAFLSGIPDYLLEEDLKVLDRQIKLVYPAAIDMQFVPSNVKELNNELYSEFLSAADCWEGIRSMRYKKALLSETMRNTLRDLAKGLETGAYAVDKNLEVNSLSVDSSVMFVKEF